jgi:hypothetical protein
LGRGEGAWIETVRVWGIAQPDAFARVITSDFMDDIARQDGVVGVHFVRGVDAQGKPATAESKLRDRPDSSCDWILLIEAASLRFLEILRAQFGSHDSLRRHGAGASIERGIYRLQYSLTHSELRRAD